MSIDTARHIVTFETLAADMHAAEAAATAEARANPPPPRAPNAGDIQRMIEERRRAAAVGRDEREADEAARRRLAFAPIASPVVGGGAGARARQLMEGATLDTLRADLRAAIGARDAAEAAHREAEEDLGRCRETIAGIAARLESLTEDDDDKDHRAISNFRSGQLGDGVDFDMERDRGVEEARLDDARRAERVLSAAVGEAHAMLLNAKEKVELLAAALIGARLEAIASALEEAEAHAASLRTLLLSASALWFSAPGVTAPIPALVTERTKHLLSCPPAGMLSVPDKAIAAEFQKHFAALLSDPDAPLVTE